MIDRYLSPSELKRLISVLLVVALFLCLLAFFAFLIIPGSRNANEPAAEVPVAAPQGESGWLDPTDFPAAKGRIVPPIDPKTVLSPNAELIARGRTVYAETCATCHGAEGQGDGPAAKGLKPPPRNFSVKDGWTLGPGIPQLYQTLEKGIPGTSMLSYSYLSKRDRMALVHVVQGFGHFQRGPEDPKGMETLARLFASSGEIVPNRIPVAKAMALLTREAQVPQALDMANPLIRAAVQDPALAAQTLALRPGISRDPDALARLLVADLPGNGFRPAVATYDKTAWRALSTALGGQTR
nr:cytochrome c [uncultured Holophaga sp.]